MTTLSRDGARPARLPRALALAAVLLLAAPYLGALAAAASGPGAETVVGVVFDEHGQPKEGVAVACSLSSSVATTGADGGYSLTGTDIDGEGVLTYSAEGYMEAEVAYDLPDGGTLSQSVYLVETTGPGTGSVAGTVTSIEGDPLEGARVTLADDAGVVGTVETDADGGYAFDAVPAAPGRTYTVTVEARGFDPVTAVADVGRGASARVDVVLALEGGAEVLKGRVTDVRGLPLPGALVSIQGTEGVWATDLAGAYRVQSDALEGPRIVVASLSGYARTSVRAEVPPGGVGWANVTLLTDGMGGPETVWVAVSEPSHGTPVEGASVSVEGLEGGWTTDARGLAVVIAEGLVGGHGVTARHDGFTTSTVDVELEDGGTASVSIAIVEASNGCSLSGHVTDAGTGAPIEGARVAVDAAGISRSTVTDASGAYYAFVLPPGVDTDVTVAADGHATVEERTQLRDLEPNVLDVALEPAAERTVDVGGVVRSVSGAPLAGAWVTLWGAVPTVVLRTDGAGEFSLLDAPVDGGRVYWLVEGQAFSAESGSLPIGDSGSVEIEVTLSPADPPQTAVVGWVRDPDGLPVRGARVSLGLAQRTWETRTDATGAYAVFLTIGSDFTGDLSATADGYGWHNQTPMLRARGTNWVNFTVPLGPGFGNVRGRVFAEGSLRPIAAADVFLGRGGAFHESALTDAGGGFAFQRVPVADGAYELGVVREGYGGATVEATVLPGGTVFLNLTLREDVPTTEALVGVVTSRAGLALPGAVAQVAGFEPVVTDQEGRFVISGTLLEGARTVVVTAPGFSPASASVDVAPGATATVSLTLEPSAGDLAIVTGTVASARDGRPLEGALVQLGWEGSGAWALEAKTGVNGSFTFLGVPASHGRVSVTASMDGFRAETVELDVGSGLVTQATVALLSADMDVGGDAPMGAREKVVIGVGAGATAVTVGALLATEVGRVALMGLFLVPLYTKIRRERMMDHFVRGRIYEHICNNPGVNFSAIKQRFNLTNGTVTYHLLMLERQEFIRSRQDGIYKRYFKEGTGATLMDESPMSLQRSILRLVGERPGISQKEIARRLGTSKQLVSYYIRNLREEGLVETHRSGRSVLVFPGSNGQR